MAPPGELRVNAGVVWLAGNTVWSTPERIRGEVLTTMRYTNRRLPVVQLSLDFKLLSLPLDHKSLSWPQALSPCPYTASLIIESCRCLVLQQEEMDKQMEERSCALEARFDECLAEQRLKQQVVILCISLDLSFRHCHYCHLHHWHHHHLVGGSVAYW